MTVLLRYSRCCCLGLMLWGSFLGCVSGADPVDMLMAEPIEVPFEPEDLLETGEEGVKKQPVLKINRADVAGKLREKLAKGELGGALAFTAEQMDDQRTKLAKAEAAGPSAWVGGLPAALAANEGESRSEICLAATLSAPVGYFRFCI